MNELILEPYAVLQHWRCTEGLLWKAMLCDYLEQLAHACAESGPCVIGHIKALALFAGSAYVQISVISPRLPASVQGSVPPDTHELTLSLNVIVYGLEHKLVERLACETAVRAAEKWKGEVIIEATGHEQHTHHSPEEH
jgi:hypothetical protein